MTKVNNPLWNEKEINVTCWYSNKQLFSIVLDNKAIY